MRPIDADALGIYKFETNDAFRGFVTVIPFDLVMTAPTIEAEPVRHGKWEEYQIPHIICCSECDYGTCVDEKTKFCPNCGAKMDLK